MANGPKEQLPPTPEFQDPEAAPPPSEGSYEFSGLPEGFDPTSDEQLRSLEEDELIFGLQSPDNLFPEATGETNDMAWVGLHANTFPDADPRQVVAYRALFREWLRRTAQNPQWEITPGFLFPEQGDTDGK